MSISEERLHQVRQAISDVVPADRTRRPSELELPAVVDELCGWLADDHQAVNAFPPHWVSLLDDILSAADKCGPQLRAALLAEQPRVLDEFRTCRAILKRARRPPDPSLRRRIEHAAQSVAQKLVGGDALAAAFHDLLAATDRDAARTRAGLLIAMSTEAGHDPTWFPSRLRDVLRDEPYAIASERDEPLPDGAPDRGGATPQARVAIIEEILSQPPRKGDVIVWLRFNQRRSELATNIEAWRSRDALQRSLAAIRLGEQCLAAAGKRA